MGSPLSHSMNERSFLLFLKTVHNKKYFPLLLMLDRVNEKKKFEVYILLMKSSAIFQEPGLILKRYCIAKSSSARTKNLELNETGSNQQLMEYVLLCWKMTVQGTEKQSTHLTAVTYLAERPRSTTNKLPKIELILVYIPERTEVHLLL